MRPTLKKTLVLVLIFLGCFLVLCGFFAPGQGEEKEGKTSPTLSDGEKEAASLAAFFPKQQVLTFRTQAGSRPEIRAYVAETPAQKERGLMFVRKLPQNKGMIFPNRFSMPVMFWMKNTYLPLDLIFYQADGRISRIYANATPLSESFIPSNGFVAGVVEVNGGWCQAHQVRVGDSIEGVR